MIQNIPKRNIGQTNVQISELGLGCAPLGGNLVDLSREEAAAPASPDAGPAASTHGMRC